MRFSDLANELVLHIFQSCKSIPDALSLAATCHHFQAILKSSHRLPILYQAAEAQFGPLVDATRLVTHNTSQPAHLPRTAPPQSFALLKRLLQVGHVANQWATIYPNQKWRGPDSAYRRLLTELEAYRLRRACYRIWLFALAFHTPAFPRVSRLAPPIVRLRAALLRPWPSIQLAEILDLQAIFRQVLQSHVCPSNGTVLRRHKQRYPDDPFPLVSITTPSKYMQQHAQFHAQSYSHGPFHVPNPIVSKSNPHGITVEGWGDEITHYYVIEDVLKFDPGQMIYLFESIASNEENVTYNTGNNSKGLVESFVAGFGDWFENNGETMSETVGFVIGERGGDMCELKEFVEGEWEGIARRETEG